MAEKAKHAFGSLENVDSAISSGKIDSYDILFVKDAEGKPYVGWIDKDGNKVICDNSAEFEALESQLATKANVADVEVIVNEQIEIKVEEIIEEKIAEIESSYEIVEF